jgi:hypothetical protein
MGSETVTDYETVETSKTVYYCDHCDTRFENRDELSVVEYYDERSHTQVPPDRSQELCDRCCGLQRALELEADRERLDSVLAKHARSIAKSINLAGYTIAVIGTFAFTVQLTLFAALGRIQHEGEYVNTFSNAWMIVDGLTALAMWGIAQILLLGAYLLFKLVRAG